MTYGRDLFSDAPPASMLTTATITTTLGALLASCLSIIQDRASALRIVAFVLIMGLGATTANAEYYRIVSLSDASFPATDPQCWSRQHGHLIGQGADTITALAALVYAQTSDVVCNNRPNDPNYQKRPDPLYTQGTTFDRVRVPYGQSGYWYAWGYATYEVLAEPPPGCQAGQTSTLNLGVGYAKTTANTDDWIDPQFYTTACNSGCQATVGNIVSGSCYVSGIVGPPFPGYCEFETTTTGNACTPADEAATATLPAIPCPQGMAEGTVNGARGCYKVSDVTKETTTTQNPDGTTTTTETITGPTGTTTTTTTCTGDGSCSTTIQHIGGGAGTGAPGETGQDYDGKPTGSDTPSEGEEEQGEPCGREGLPDCRVKVNEEGTPTEVEGAQEFLDGVVDGIQERYDYLGGMGWVVEDLPFVWNPSIPTGSCSAYEIYGYTIDICDPLGKARAVWAWVISILAAIYIWRTATEGNKGA